MIGAKRKAINRNLLISQEYQIYTVKAGIKKIKLPVTAALLKIVIVLNDYCGVRYCAYA